MKITVEFDSYEEFAPFLGVFAPPTSVPPVDNEHVAPGAEQFAPPAEKPKRTRRTKAEMAAAAVEALNTTANPVDSVDTKQIADEFEDAPPANDDFLDEPAAPAVKVTKDDVRAALVAYQERLVERKVPLEEARTTVLNLMRAVSGMGPDGKLGGLAEDKFELVINAAKAAK